MTSLRLCVPVALLSICALPRPANAQYTFMTIDAPGASLTRAAGINATGTIAGTYSDAAGVHGYLDDGGVFTVVDAPGAINFPAAPFGLFGTYAYHINAMGAIVGDYRSSAFHGFLYSGGVFTDLDVPNQQFTFAYGINDNGDIVGQTGSRSTHGFVYSSGVFTLIDAPGASFTAAYDINAAGNIVGLFNDAAGQHGFLDSGGVFSSIDVPGANATVALGINDGGNIVGWFRDAVGQHGFLYAAGVFTTIDVPGASSTIAAGENSAGTIVGQYTDPTGTHGFVASLADTTAPALANVPAPIVVEGNTLGGAIVTFRLPAASDPDDTAGAVTCSPTSGLVFPLATTTVMCSSTDTHGNSGNASFTVTVVDTTPPELTLPANITINASGPSGSIVTYAAYGNDTVWGNVSVTCTTASGALFAIGTTTINCSATDGSGESATGSFTVTVLGGAEITSNLLRTVVVDGSEHKNNLLSNVLSLLNKGNTTAGCNQLGAFINQVKAQSGKSDTLTDANALITTAMAAKAAFGCPLMP